MGVYERWVSSKTRERRQTAILGVLFCNRVAMEIEKAHQYFVGQQLVLVHNAGANGVNGGGGGGPDIPTQGHHLNPQQFFEDNGGPFLDLPSDLNSELHEEIADAHDSGDKRTGSNEWRAGCMGGILRPKSWII